MRPAILFTYALIAGWSACAGALPPPQNSTANAPFNIATPLESPPLGSRIDLATTIAIGFGTVGNGLSIAAVYAAFKQLAIMNALLARGIAA